MDEFIKAMEGFIQASNQTYENWPNKKKTSRKWEECFLLLKAGWKVEEYAEIAGSDDILVKWNRAEDKKEIRITFTDQVLWLEFLERQGSKK